MFIIQGTSSPSDPRYIKHADPRLLAALQQYGLDSTYPEVTYHNNEPVLQTSPISFKLDFYKRVEKGYEKMNKMLADGLLDSALAEVNNSCNDNILYDYKSCVLC